MQGSAGAPDRTRASAWVLVPVLALAATLFALTLEHRSEPLLGEGLIHDSWDVGIYFERARFYTEGQVPYVHAPAEYPVLGILSLAAPHLFATELDEATYALYWGRLMGGLFLATLAVVIASRRRWGLPIWPVALLASPTFLYFTVNRFDILPALVCCGSLLALQQRRTALAYLLLGLGVHVKWYPAVVFPVFLAYHLEQEGLLEARLRGLLRSQALRWASLFVGTVLTLVLACIAVFGWDGFLVPYRFHGDRGAQWLNVYWIAEQALRPSGALPSVRPWLDVGFVGAQVAFGFVVLWLRPKTLHDVFRYSVLAIVLFVSFAKIDSPQWILWYAPLALMFARDTRTLAALGALSLLNYAVFPLAFGVLTPGGGTPPFEFQTLVLAKDLALLGFVVWLLRESEPTP